MGELICLGLTHFPPLMGPDEGFSRALRRMCSDPGMPAALREPAGWPEEMRAEWGDDEGRAAAAAHREQIVAALGRVRAALDAFDPDVVVVVADDQYENFRETGVPAFCVQAFDDMTLRPWRDGEQAEFAASNVWGEGPEDPLDFRGDPETAKGLATGLLDEGFDVAYAYEPIIPAGLSHAFLNTLLYLDYDRAGFDRPVIPVAVNCYGRFVVSHHGRYPKLTESVEIADLDPPSPHPWRCFDFGAALGRVVAELPGRVALVASSSWSHGFLTRAHNFLYPDVEADLRLFEALRAGDFAAFRALPRQQLEDAGQQEVLNWACLAGACQELGLAVDYAELVTTRIFNSDKCFAVIR
jgi:hypothetical protein